MSIIPIMVLAFWPVNAHWQRLPKFGSAPTVRTAAQMIVVNDSLYLMGGSDGMLTLNALFRYGPLPVDYASLTAPDNTAFWYRFSPFKAPPTRKDFVMGDFGGVPIITGGSGETTYLSDSWIFQFEPILSWIQIPDSSSFTVYEPRMGSCGAVIQNRFFIGFGSTLANSTGIADLWEQEWSPKTSSRWVRLPDPRDKQTGRLMFGRNNGACAPYNDQYFLVHGGFGGSIRGGGIYSDLWSYDVTNAEWNDWTPSGPDSCIPDGCPVGRAYHTIHTTQDALWLFFGWTSDDENIGADVWRLDSFTNPNISSWRKVFTCTTAEQVSNPTRCPIGRNSHASSATTTAAFIFGGDVDGQSTPSAEFWMFHFEQAKFYLIHGEMQTPEKRMHHMMEVIGTHIVVLFGLTYRNAQPVYLDDCWGLDLAEYPSPAWHTLPVSLNAANPIARHSASLVSRGLQLFMFGGLAKDGVARNDVWLLNPRSNSASSSLTLQSESTIIWDWVEQSPTATSKSLPPIRYGHAAVMVSSYGDGRNHKAMMIIYGGKNNRDRGYFYDDCWVYYFAEAKWELLTATIFGGASADDDARVYSSFTLLLRDSDVELVILGGVVGTALPASVWVLTLSDTNKEPCPNSTETWEDASCNASGLLMRRLDNYKTVFPEDADKDYSRFQTGLSTSSAGVIYSFGGQYYESVVDDFIAYDSHCLKAACDPVLWRKPKPTTSASVLWPEPMYGGKAVVVGSQFIMFGGGASEDSTAVPGEVSNEMWTFDLNPCPKSMTEDEIHSNKDWCIRCSTGSIPASVNGSDICQLCPPGTFSSDISDLCEPCPEGFHSTVYSAADRYICRPCVQSYQDLPGQPLCKPCPPGNVCPLASTIPLDATALEEFVTPGRFNPPSFISRGVPWWAWFVIAGLSGAIIIPVVVLVILLRHRLAGFCAKFDIFSTKHHNDPGDFVQNKTTYLGGITSILWVIAVCIFIAVFVMQFVLENVKEDTALQPNIKTDKTNFTADFNFSVWFFSYTGQCTLQAQDKSDFSVGDCSDISATAPFDQQLFGSRIRTSCRRAHIGAYMSNICMLTIECADCTIRDGGTISIVYSQTDENDAHASMIGLNLSVSTGIDGFFSSQWLYLIPSSGDRVFAGLVPSIAQVTLLQTMFADRVSLSRAQTGYHLQVNSVETGSEVSDMDFHSTAFVYLNIKVGLDSNSLLINRYKKETEVQFIGSLMGSVFGILGIFAAGMNFFEKWKAKFLKSEEEQNPSKLLSLIIEKKFKKARQPSTGIPDGVQASDVLSPTFERLKSGESAFTITEDKPDGHCHRRGPHVPGIDGPPGSFSAHLPGSVNPTSSSEWPEITSEPPPTTITAVHPPHRAFHDVVAQTLVQDELPASVPSASPWMSIRSPTTIESSTKNQPQIAVPLQPQTSSAQPTPQSQTLNHIPTDGGSNPLNQPRVLLNKPSPSSNSAAIDDYVQRQERFLQEMRESYEVLSSNKTDGRLSGAAHVKL